MTNDVIIQWNHGGVPSDVLGGFARPTKVITVPTGSGFRDSVRSLGQKPVRALLKRHGIDDAGRVAVVGFSASCQGVSEIIESQDAGIVETVIAIDGIHARVEGWSKFAKVASFGIPPTSPAPKGQRHLWITHSAVKPPSYKSTTETAAEIITNVLGNAPDLTVDMDMYEEFIQAHTSWTCEGGSQSYQDGSSIKWDTTEYPTPPIKYASSRKGFWVVGYDNLDKTGHCDHVYQAQVVLSAAATMLMRRWNRQPPDLGCVAA